MSETELRNIVEAALLAAGRPLPIGELAALFDDSERPTASALRAVLGALTSEYESRALQLIETASGWRVQVRSQFAAQVSRLWPERPQKYSRALLETLALIAYRQPITRGEIEAVRGVAVNPNILRTLTERGWVRVVGQRDVPGHPELLGTTREFLDYFGLKSLDQLPTLAELMAMTDLSPQLALPVSEDEAPASDGAALAARLIEAGEPMSDDEPGEGDDDELDAATDQKPGLVAAPGDPDR